MKNRNPFANQRRLNQSILKRNRKKNITPFERSEVNNSNLKSRLSTEITPNIVRHSSNLVK